MSLAELQKYTFTAKYARWNKEKNRRENWGEAVARVKGMMMEKYKDKPEVHADIDFAYDMMKKKRVLGSQRALQFGGKPILDKNMKIYNCIASYCDRPRFFAETMYLLLCGCGTGFSVQFQHVNKLPPVLPINGNKVYQIPDSIEGWADAINVLISSYLRADDFQEYHGVIVDFDYSKIRAEGQQVGEYGRAPGPEPLKKALENIRKILNGAIGRKLKPIECYDIIMHSSDAVLSGGIRRAATIALFSLEDEDMMNAKTGNWFYENPQRGRSNNSVVLVKNKTSSEQFDSIMDRVREFGEPGFLLVDDEEALVNPCCLPGSATLYKIEEHNGVKTTTKTPLSQLKIGDKILSKDGSCTILDKWSNGTKNLKRYRCEFSYGDESLFITDIVITPDHKIETKDGLKEIDKSNNCVIRLTINDEHVFVPGVIAESQDIDSEEVFDIEVDSPSHTFICNDISVSNCEIGLYGYNAQGDSGWQACVSYDTKLITKNGIVTIGDSVGCDVEIWNGEEWSVVKPRQTGQNRKLFRVHMSDGTFLDCTENHKWLTDVNGKSSVKTTQEIIEHLATKSKRSLIHVPRSNISSEISGVYEEFAYEYGFVLGDGTARLNHSPFAGLFDQDINLGLRGIISEEKNNGKYNVSYRNITFTDLNKELSVRLKYDTGLPIEIIRWGEKSLLQFFAGWIDSDGTKANYGCRLYGQKDKLAIAQLLLTKLGIVSSLNLMSKKGTKTNYSIRNRDVYYLQIPNASKIPSRRINLSEGKDPICKGSRQIIRFVEELPGLHDTFCVDEPKLHQCVFNNVLTKQCNLSTINISKLKDENEFYESCRAAAIIGTLQAGFLDAGYLTNTSREIIAREALIGVSMTGIMEKPEIAMDPDIQKRGAEIVKSTNKEIAAKIGINPAARCTTVKPEGSSSCMLGTSSGIHPHHAKRYIRRVQANKLEQVYQHFKKFNPRACERSVWSNNNTDDVIAFCVEVPDGAKLKNKLSAITLLDAVKLTQNNWVKYGKDESLCVRPWLTHNVSNTINVKQDEWKDIGPYLYDHREFFCGISLLPVTGDKDYPQAPFTAVYLPSEMIKFYGDGVMFVSGLIENALELYEDNLWTACDALNLRRDILGTAKKKWVQRCEKFAVKYFFGDLKLLTYAMKDVYNYKLWTELQLSYTDVDYQELIETTDNTKLSEELACSGGACEIR